MSAKVTGISIGIMSLLLVLLISGSAYAGVAGVLAENDNNEFFVYEYNELIDSYAREVLGLPALLFDDFSKKTVRALSTAQKGFVRYEEILNAYTRAVIQGKTFDVVLYINGSTAAPLAVPPNARRVFVENGALKYEFITPQPPPLPPPGVLETINGIMEVDAMRQALLQHGTALALDMTNFNQLNAFGRNQVANSLIWQRPLGGYPTQEDIRQSFFNASLISLIIQNNAVQAINIAATPIAMQTALQDFAAVLQLPVSRLHELNDPDRERMLLAMLAGRTYVNAEAVSNAFFAAFELPAERMAVRYTNYTYTLRYFVDMQMGRNPQTDLLGGGWRTADRNLVEFFINPLNFKDDYIPAAALLFSSNLREGPSTRFNIVATLPAGAGPFFILNQVEDGEGYTWYRLLTNLRAGWIRGDLLAMTQRQGAGIFQFLVLSGSAGADAGEVNEKILKGKGVLEGKAATFIQASQENNINEIFLISLALHESGNGTSRLATGVTHNGAVVYNMFGIGAFDRDPINLGAKFAFEQGWFTPELAIIGGARFVSQNYINHSTFRQDTLYKMRWNPGMPGVHQYATDIGWAVKQVNRIHQLYQLLDTYILHFDIPVFQ